MEIVVVGVEDNYFVVFYFFYDFCYIFFFLLCKVKNRGCVLMSWEVYVFISYFGVLKLVIVIMFFLLILRCCKFFVNFNVF